MEYLINQVFYEYVLDISDDDLDELKKSSRPALINIPNTEHPIEITLRNDDEDFDADESVYDVLERKFIKLIEKEDIKEVPSKYVEEISKFFSIGFTIHYIIY